MKYFTSHVMLAVISLIPKKSKNHTEPVDQFQVVWNWAQQKGPGHQNVSTAGVEDVPGPEASSSKKRTEGWYIHSIKLQNRGKEFLEIEQFGNTKKRQDRQDIFQHQQEMVHHRLGLGVWDTCTSLCSLMPSSSTCLWEDQILPCFLSVHFHHVHLLHRLYLNTQTSFKTEIAWQHFSFHLCNIPAYVETKRSNKG